MVLSSYKANIRLFYFIFWFQPLVFLVQVKLVSSNKQTKL